MTISPNWNFLRHFDKEDERGAGSNIDQLAAGASAGVCESRPAAPRGDISSQLLEDLSAAMIIFTVTYSKMFCVETPPPCTSFQLFPAFT